MAAPTVEPGQKRFLRGPDVRPILEVACRENRRVEIRNPKSPPSAAREIGILVCLGAEGTSLLIAPRAPLHHASPGSLLDVSFQNNLERISFRSALISVKSDAAGYRAVVAIPTSLQVLDRRRSPRRRLRDRSRVVVRSIDSDPSWSATGPLLNLSATGLAFLLEGPRPESLSIGKTVHAAIESREDASHGFGGPAGVSLPARVANVTEGADPQTWLIGIEFLPQQISSQGREHLAALLRGSRKE